MEFLDPGASSAWRPWEALTPFMLDSMVRQLNRFANASPVPQADGTGNAMAFTLMTGDMVDNQQRNEAIWVRELLEGGTPINFNSGLSDPSDYANPSGLGASCPAFLLQEGGPGAAATEGAAYTGVQDFNDYPVDPGANAAYYDPDDVRGTWAASGWPAIPGCWTAPSRSR